MSTASRRGHATATVARRRPARALGALAVANARFWPTVAPHAKRELASWQTPAQRIPDRELRELALAKLRDEPFNGEVAATLATLAPRRSRANTVQAIVAMEVLFDYLDGRTELPMSQQIQDGDALYGPFVHAASAGLHDRSSGTQPDTPDGDYIQALAQRAGGQVARLPALGAVAAPAHRAAERCAQAQVRIHAAARGGEDSHLQEWASGRAAGSGLGWREYTAGCASSVLAVHALIAAGADAATTEAGAERIDEAYLATGALITMLDSLVDHESDRARGEDGFNRLFENAEELQESLLALTREALRRASLAPHAAHHTMTLAGVVAYYTTHEGARDAHARDTVRLVRAELSPTIWPTLAVMRAWRATKQARSKLDRASRAPRINENGRARGTRGIE